MRQTRLFVIDPDGDQAGEIKLFVGSEVITRNRGIGAWTVRAVPTPIIDLLGTPGAGIEIERNGQEIIGGPTISVKRNWSDGREVIDVSGLSRDVYLSDFLAYPCAATGAAGAVFPAASHDVRSGSAETAMKGFVAANMVTGGAWATGRALTGLSVATDLGRGASGTWRARFPVLSDLLIEIAIAGGDMGFGINADRVFDVWLPRDMTDTIVLSRALRSLWSIESTTVAPRTTDVVVAGQGEEVDRTFRLGGDSARRAKWHRRIEVFRDARDIPDADAATELPLRLADSLADGAEQLSVSVRPRSNAAMTEDIRLGDRITIAEQEATVNEIRYTLDANGDVVEPIPSLSAVFENTIAEIFASLNRLERNVNALERIN